MLPFLPMAGKPLQDSCRLKQAVAMPRRPRSSQPFPFLQISAIFPLLPMVGVPLLSSCGLNQALGIRLGSLGVSRFPFFSRQRLQDCPAGSHAVADNAPRCDASPWSEGRRPRAGHCRQGWGGKGRETESGSSSFRHGRHDLPSAKLRSASNHGLQPALCSALAALDA